jgi:glycolate oxidase FAD binding subunit
MNESWLTDRLAGIVGAEYVATGRACETYAVDGIVPQAMTCPASVEELSEIMKLASAEGLAVVPWGGGTKIGLGNIPARVDLVVGLARLRRVIDHEPADLTATFQGGAPLAEVQEHLGQQGQFLPLDPPHPERATIGGILATNTSGPRRVRYGAARDLVIGIRIVHADGTITKGGAKVVKNVTGYDMNKLYIGSLGTLGIIVEATFRISPLPAAEQTWLASFPTGASAACVVAGILDSTIIPSRVELLSFPAARSVGRQAGLLPPNGRFLLAASVASVPEAVDAQIGVIKQIAERHGSGPGVLMTGVSQQAFWTAVNSFGATNGSEGVRAALKASVLPTKVVETISRGEEIAQSGGLSPASISEAASGIVRLHWTGDAESSEGAASRMAKGIEVFRAAVESDDGSLVVLSAPAPVKRAVDVWGPVGTSLPLMRALKGQFDPKGILNPGRFVGGI